MPDLILFHAKGTSDMGSLEFLEGTDVNNEARFKVEKPNMAISGLRVHFATVPGEGGTGVAPLAIRVDSHRGSAFDMTLWTLSKAGIDHDVDFRVPAVQQEHFYIEKGDYVVITWTNPDDEKIEWGLMLAMRQMQ